MFFHKNQDDDEAGSERRIEAYTILRDAADRRLDRIRDLSYPTVVGGLRTALRQIDKNKRCLSCHLPLTWFPMRPFDLNRGSGLRSHTDFCSASRVKKKQM